MVAKSWVYRGRRLRQPLERRKVAVLTVRSSSAETRQNTHKVVTVNFAQSWRKLGGGRRRRRRRRVAVLTVRSSSAETRQNTHKVVTVNFAQSWRKLGGGRRRRRGRRRSSRLTNLMT